MATLSAIFGGCIGGLAGWILDTGGWIGILIAILVGSMIFSCALSLFLKLQPIKPKDEA